MSRSRWHRRFHLGASLVWVLLAVPTVLWWRDSILWVALISVYANIVGHWGAYEAGRAAEHVDKQQS